MDEWLLTTGPWRGRAMLLGSELPKGPVETSPTALTFLVEFLSSTGNSVPSPVTIRDGDGHRAREGWETGQPLAGQGTGTGLLGWWMDSLQPVLFGFFH